MEKKHRSRGNRFRATRFPVKTLLAFLTVAIIGLALYFNSTPPPRDIADELIPDTAQITASKERNLDSIATKNCFESPAAPASLSLAATLILSDPSDSVALVEFNTGKGLAVRGGDQVGKGAFEVIRVARQVICVRDAKTKKFYTVRMRDPVPQPAAIVAIAEAVGIKRMNDFEIAVPATLIKREILDLNSLLNSAMAIPEKSEVAGKLAGFRLASIDPSSLFLALGLKVNDVITTVNKIAMDSPAKALAVFQSLQGVSIVEVGIVRNGQKKTISYTKF